MGSDYDYFTGVFLFVSRMLCRNHVVGSVLSCFSPFHQDPCLCIRISAHMLEEGLSLFLRKRDGRNETVIVAAKGSVQCAGAVIVDDYSGGTGFSRIYNFLSKAE